MKYNNEVIDFFKRHNLYEEEMFRYLEDHSDLINYENEDEKLCIGCAYLISKRTGKLLRFRIGVPYVYDEETLLIAIHEIVHGIIGYKRLNKKFNYGIRIEALPFLYEKICLDEIKSNNLNNYASYLDEMVNHKSNEEYRFAIYARDYLYNNYDKNIKNMDKLSKKLVKKYEKLNK